jgi:hypothetical protein
MSIVVTLIIYAVLSSSSLAQGTMSTDGTETSSAEASLSGVGHFPRNPLNEAELQEDDLKDSRRTEPTSDHTNDEGRSDPHRSEKKRHGTR